jgi:hypothetical protein
MPVRKFRSVEAMEPAPWRQPGDPALFRAIAAVWDFGDRTLLRRFPPGVFRYRSIEEMKRAEEDWAGLGLAAGRAHHTAPAR